MNDEQNKATAIESVSVSALLKQSEEQGKRRLRRAVAAASVFICVPIISGFLGVAGLNTPVHYAIDHDLPVMAKIFCHLGFKNQRQHLFKGGCIAPLQLAANRGSIEMVDILLDSGADIYFNYSDDYMCQGLGKRYGEDIMEASAKYPALVAHLVKDRGIDRDLTAKRLEQVATEKKRVKEWHKEHPAPAVH